MCETINDMHLPFCSLESVFASHLVEQCKIAMSYKFVIEHREGQLKPVAALLVSTGQYFWVESFARVFSGFCSMSMFVTGKQFLQIF